ncbi:MAG: hypothetical protein QXR60_04595 [Candidatus Nanoarchaeia archaeon]
MEEKKKGVFEDFLSTKKQPAEKPKKESKKVTIPTKYIIIVFGVIFILVFGFFFFSFVINKDKAYAFEKNLQDAVNMMYSLGVGSTREIVIPVPSSVESVCFQNYKEGSDFGVQVTSIPESIDTFKMKGLFSVEKDSFCFTTDGSLKAKMQYLSKSGSNFVAVYLNSIDPNIYSTSTFVSQVSVEQTQETGNETIIPETETNQTEEYQNETEEKSIAQTACESAAANNNCARLADLGLITAEQCCSSYSLCC